MWKKIKHLTYLVLALSLLSTQCAFGALVIERRVSTSSDDVEQDVANLDVDLGSSDLELPSDGGLQLIGMRFTELDIPADAVILEAWLQFQVDELEGDQPVNLLIEGELSPNPVTFSEDANNVGARPRTEAKVLWSVPHWPTVNAQDPNQRSTDITPIIEELISQDGWQAGNAMVIIIRDDPDDPSMGLRTAHSYSLPSGAPLLHITIFGETATDPVPAHGAQNVTPASIAWVPGDTAQAHEVYFGATPTLGPDEFKGRQGATEYALDIALAPGTTYYWRVDEVADDGVTIHTGDTWSFSTVALAPHTPAPAQGAKWMDTETDLNWSAGRDTVMYDVYFGTDPDAVANGTGDTLKSRESSTSHALAALEENTTYYWRVDGFEADAVTQHAGPLWHFTTTGPGGGIKAQYYQYSADSPPTPAETAFDENELWLTRIDPQINFDFDATPVETLGSDRFSAKWIGEVEVAFSEPYSFSTRTDDGLKLWVNGQLLITNWTLHGATIDTSKPVDLIAGQRYPLEMWWFENSGGAMAELYWASPSTPRQLIPQGALSEPRMARRPLPNNHAENVMQTPILSWAGGDKVGQHDVYFGTDAQAVANADTTTADIYRGRQDVNERVFHPGPLAWNQTYYWRVDEVNELEAESPWTGSVWQFTTADFLVVDDFELYTDDITDRIFQTWIDGWGYSEPEPGNPGNGTGSTVGYTQIPFTERTIIHTGNQSMPLAYNNAEAPFYSETVRTWETAQDWTVNAVDTLILWLRGSSSNGPDPLHVTLEDSAGQVVTVVNPNPDAVRNPLWTAWEIPLSQFSDLGLDLSAIKVMYLGLGDRDNPSAGGTGMVFIDDINVIKPAGN